MALTVAGLLGLAAPTAKADTWNFSLTDPGNTNNITFSYTADASTTVDEGYWFEINSPVNWFLNGADQGGSNLSLWNIGSGGGIVLGFNLNLWGPQLYTGTESAPALVAGTYSFDNTYPVLNGPLTLILTGTPGGNTVSTPEPSSVLLLGVGLLGMLGLTAYQSRRTTSPGNVV